jgi:hypothetical protein
MEHLLATKKIDDAEKLLSILDYAGKRANPKNFDELDVVRKAYYTVGNTFHINKEYLKIDK